MGTWTDSVKSSEYILGTDQLTENATYNMYYVSVPGQSFPLIAPFSSLLSLRQTENIDESIHLQTRGSENVRKAPGT